LGQRTSFLVSRASRRRSGERSVQVAQFDEADSVEMVRDEGRRRRHLSGVVQGDPLTKMGLRFVSKPENQVDAPEHLQGEAFRWLSSTDVDDTRSHAQHDPVDTEASAHKSGVSDDDMLHAQRHHWRGFETDDAAVTMFIGQSANGEPLEVGVVDDADGIAIIHAMPARSKFLKGWWTP
jgi:hypothetical protein